MIIFPESCTASHESFAAEKQGPLVVQDTQMPNMYLPEVKEEIRRSKVVQNIHNQ